MLKTHMACVTTRRRYSATWAPEIYKCTDSQCLLYDILVSWHNLLPYIPTYIFVCRCVCRVAENAQAAIP